MRITQGTVAAIRGLGLAMPAAVHGLTDTADLVGEIGLQLNDNSSSSAGAGITSYLL
jgi:hypothetical protein